MKAADSNLLDGKKEADRIAAVCGERIEKESPLRLKMLILVLFSVLELWEGRDTYASGKKAIFQGLQKTFVEFSQN